MRISPPYLRLLSTLGTGLVLTTAGLAPRALAQSYTFTYLGTLGGESVATGVNRDGTVVGYSQLSTVDPHAVDRQGFVYTKAAGIQSLGLLRPGAQESYGYDVNASGLITGNSYLTGHGSGSMRHAYIFRNGTMTDLTTLGGPNSCGYGINDAGHVVGDSNPTGVRGTDARHAFWFNGKIMQSLHAVVAVGESRTDTFSVAYDINSHGQIVGATHGGTSFSDSPFIGVIKTGHAFLFSTTARTLARLKTLGGSYNVAYGINDAGQVTGTSQVPGDVHYHAFRYTEGQPMADLGTLGGAHSIAYDLNAAGDVVGTAFNAAGEVRAFIHRDGVMIDLNTLVSKLGDWILIDGRGINDRGDIVGIAKDENSVYRAFLLTALSPRPPAAAP